MKKAIIILYGVKGGDTMTRWENRPAIENPQQVFDWVKANIPTRANEPMEASLNYDGTVKILDVKNLTVSEKAQIVAQYPELAGKEL